MVAGPLFCLAAVLSMIDLAGSISEKKVQTSFIGSAFRTNLIASSNLSYLLRIELFCLWVATSSYLHATRVLWTVPRKERIGYVYAMRPVGTFFARIVHGATSLSPW